MASLLRQALIPVKPAISFRASTLCIQKVIPAQQYRRVSQPVYSQIRAMSSNKHGNEDFKLANVFDLKGKVAVVTGGGSGIGLMATQALAVNGAKVYIIGRTKEKLDTVVSTYGKDIEGEIIPIQGDVTSKQEITRMYQEISAKEKCVCILVNNSAIAGPTIQTEAKNAEELSQHLFNSEDMTFDAWTDVYRANVPQIYFMTAAFLPLLEKATQHQRGYSGCIINIGSISGMVKYYQHHPQYNAAKAAVIHLTKMTASEIAKNDLRIRVNSISPGVYPSEMTTGESNENQKSAIPKENFEGKVPAQRPGTDQDMASGIIFAATNQYLNGQNIVIDGGYILQHGMA